MEGGKAERKGGKSWKKEREERERKRVTSRGPGSSLKGIVLCDKPSKFFFALQSLITHLLSVS